MVAFLLFLFIPLLPGVGVSHQEELILAQQMHKVDERIVKMCKKELVAAKDVKLLGTRCRKTLLKYLAQQKQKDEKRKESEMTS